MGIGETFQIFCDNLKITNGETISYRYKRIPRQLNTDFYGLVSGIVSLLQAADKREKLQKELATVYSRAPRTNSNVYAKAQQALKYNEDLTFSVEEIDAFCRMPLRNLKETKIPRHDLTSIQLQRIRPEHDFS